LRRPQEFEPVRRDLAEMAHYPNGTGGFSKLFAELGQCVRRDPGDPTTHGEFNDTDMHYWLPNFWNAQARPAN